MESLGFAQIAVFSGLGVVVAVAITYILAKRHMVSLVEELSALKNQMGNKESELERLQAELAQLQGEHHELEQSERQMALYYERVKSELASAQESLAQLKEEKLNLTTSLSTLQDERAELASKVSESSTALKQSELSLSKQIALKEEQIAEYKQRLTQHTEELKLSQTKVGELSNELASLKSGLEEKERSFEAQQKRLTEQESHIRKEFENLANKIFESKGKTFNEQSRQTINDLLHPFKQQMSDFRKKVEDIHLNDVKQQATLSKELSDLKSLNLAMTEQAHDLATALQGQKKTQGNWGELILENILDRSGLVLGRDYKREVSFNTEEGRQRPDAVVYLPQDKHLIIDAKVSLNAYTRYINSEDDNERAVALKEHVSAVEARIKELSDRNYYQIEELKSPEMVFMFVPIESAFVEALKADESLFQKAIEKNVLVATPTTLLTSLNIVRQLWRFEDQNRHTAELADRAGKVYDKLRGFIGSMEGVGKQLDKAKETYDKAFQQLHTGKGNLIKQASDFHKLGVSVKVELPKELVEKAEMELEASAHIEEDAVKQLEDKTQATNESDAKVDDIKIEETASTDATDNKSKKVKSTKKAEEEVDTTLTESE